MSLDGRRRKRVLVKVIGEWNPLARHSPASAALRQCLRHANSHECPSPLELLSIQRN